MKLLRDMWLPMSMLFLAASAAQAGIIKVAMAPVVHPKHTAHVLGRATRHTAHAVKAAIY